MASMLHTKWTTAKNAAAPEDLKRCSFNKGLGPVLEKLDKKIDDASEKDGATGKAAAELQSLFKNYQVIAKDYLQQILKANQKYPTSGRSWLVLHEGLEKVDMLLVDMLKQDAKVQGTKRLSGFASKSDFQSAPPAQPPANEELSGAALVDYNTEGFKRLVAKVKGGGNAAGRANALLVGIKTCLPHNRTLSGALSQHANAFNQQVAQFETALAASDLTKANTLLQGAAASGKAMAAAVPAEVAPDVLAGAALPLRRVFISLRIAAHNPLGCVV
jgi:hypothetical protein